ncbi:Nif3-like dinuclear metal center hexameric protein [Chryseomicrobium palamuruense]|uniref:GTP cyclohydrolase 1 type 2 homolog n=1 Tax=Chryseomicrobium palamuruense TaxID=682973 RepID=A0ABV8UXR2_9BACL
MNGNRVIELFEKWAMPSLAYDWDPIGLHIGTLNKVVTNVLVTLDVTPEVIGEAISKKCELIIAHHPPIFSKLKAVDTSTYLGAMIETCIKHNIAVYVAHTNLDIAIGGVNDMLADALQLQNKKILTETYNEPVMKLAVFTPLEQTKQVREALAEAGAGEIGDYEHVSYSIKGTGRFRPAEGANPFIGEIGKMEMVDEEKIEVVFPQSLKSRVLKAMFRSHPYEEVAYDLYTMAIQANEHGLGRIGSIEPTSLEDFANYVKTHLGVPFVRIAGDRSQTVERVAVLGGNGSKYIFDAKRAGADVLVSGDIDFHTAQDANANGLSIIDAGHHIESVMKKGTVEYMTKMMQQEKKRPVFHASELSTEPFEVI